MAFENTANNLVKISVVSHASGSGTMILAIAGTQFPSAPFRITAVTGPTYQTTAESLTIFIVTAVSTNTPQAGQCTLSVTVAEGTSDQTYTSSDFAEMRLTAGTITDLNTVCAPMLSEAASTLIGNPAGSPANATTIPLGATLTFSGGALQTAAHTGDVTTGANSFVTTIAANAITTTKITAANVTYAKIQNVATVSLLGNPTGSPAAPSEVTLASGLSFVGTTLSVDLAATIADKSVLGNLSGGSAAPTASTLTAFLDNLLGSAQGDIPYRGAATWTALAPGTSGQVLASQGAGANPHWITVTGTGTVTTVSVVSANGFAGTVATATTTPAITISTSITGILIGNGTAITAASVMNQGAQGQLNLAEQTQPGTLVSGDMWNDSTQHCHTRYSGSATSANCLVEYRAGLIFSMVTPVTVTATGANTLISTTNARGTNALPAGFFNVLGRYLEVTFAGVITTGATPLNHFFIIKLGSTVIGTYTSAAMSASRTNTPFTGYFNCQCQSTGATGTVNTMGTVWCPSPVVFNQDRAVTLSNGTAAGTAVPQTPVTVDLTAALTLDFQNDFTAANAVNSITLQYLTIKVYA
jgi:hypothetical protein